MDLALDINQKVFRVDYLCLLVLNRRNLLSKETSD